VEFFNLISNQLVSLFLENILDAWLGIRVLLCIRDEQEK